MGPRLGDFLHSLVVPYYLWHEKQIKTNLYINEKYDSFMSSLDQTYNELLPIIQNQEYINIFQIYDESIHQIDIDLNQFRFNQYLYKKSFWAIFMHTAFHEIPVVPYNLEILKIEPDFTYQNCLLIHRRHDGDSNNPKIQKYYENVIKKFDKVFFIENGRQNYDKFFLKDRCELLNIPDLKKYMEVLKGCKILMVNICGTLAMASALNIPRIGELHGVHVRHYAFDDLYFDNVEFFDKHTIFTQNPKYLS